METINLQIFCKKNQKLHLIRSNSHDIKTLKQVQNIIGKTKIDFLFIDGDQTYEGVKQDFEMYRRLVSKEGLIAFHDINPGPEEEVGEVPRLWQEIKKKYPNLEIIDKDSESNSYGIGLLLSNKSFEGEKF